MRIFIHYSDPTGSRRTTRVHLLDCPTTTTLINQICKSLGVKKLNVVLSLKYEPFNIRIVEQWPFIHYPIKNGSIFLLQPIQTATEQLLPGIVEDIEEHDSQGSRNRKVSFNSSVSERDDTYFQQCLERLLQAIKQGDLSKVAAIMKQEPPIEDQKQLNKLMQIKDKYLLREVGDHGKNCLHQAINCNNSEIVSFLLIKGANPRIPTIEEYSTLQLAVKSHSPEIIKILLEQNYVDVNQITPWGTALHLSVANQDLKCVQMLLQYDADIEAVDRVGRKPVDLCSNKKIRQILQKKGKMVKADNLTISKGQVYEVSSYMRRHKERTMTLNPFTQVLLIESKEKENKYKYHLQQIKKVLEIEQLSWLMNQAYFYFKIVFKSSDKNEITIALKHQKTFNRWFNNLSQAVHNSEHSTLLKPVPISEQVIELINDDTNSISFHRRKAKESSKPIVNNSIFKLSVAEDAEEPNYFIRIKSPEKQKPQEDFSTYSRENLLMKESQVIPGSVIHFNDNSSTQSPCSQYQFPQIVEETFIESNSSISNSNSCLNTSETNNKFRKNSERIEILSEFKVQDRPQVKYRDFQLIKLIGNGSFGQVYLARHKPTNMVYALKVLNKKKLIAKKQLKYAVSEANILKKMNSQFIISLHYAFQTSQHLYMALDNCPNGDLSEIIIVRERLAEDTACFVIAQVILAVQHLHSRGILYRDMKPQNILIAADGYIKLTDFGLSKQNCFSMSFCGSPAYLSPEMLQKKGVGFESDIYGIGTVLHEMVVGEPPFYDDDMQVMFQNIKKGKLKFPSFLSIQVQSLLSRLLERQASKRLGSKDFAEIKKHQFFKKLRWDQLAKKKIVAPPELFLAEEDREFEPVALEKTQSLKLEEIESIEAKSNMMNRVKNFTFVKNPHSQNIFYVEKEQSKSKAI